jgi:hypothetical protein
LNDLWLIWQLSGPEQGLRDKPMQRYEKWHWIKNGFPAIGDDPFAAVTYRQWTKALQTKIDRERETLAAAVSARVPAPKVTIRDLATVEAARSS